jgi:hypothetical protein
MKNFKKTSTSLYHKRGGFAMDLNDAVMGFGRLVIANDAYWGMYIGELGKTDQIRGSREEFSAQIKILYCLRYPSQQAMLQRAFCTREPFDYNTVHGFNLNEVHFYLDEQSEDFTEFRYKQSVVVALKQEINKYGIVDAREKEILLEHLDKLQFPATIARLENHFREAGMK